MVLARGAKRPKRLFPHKGRIIGIPREASQSRDDGEHRPRTLAANSPRRQTRHPPSGRRPWDNLAAKRPRLRLYRRSTGEGFRFAGQVRHGPQGRPSGPQPHNLLPTGSAVPGSLVYDNLQPPRRRSRHRGHSALPLRRAMPRPFSSTPTFTPARRMVSTMSQRELPAGPSSDRPTWGTTEVALLPSRQSSPQQCRSPWSLRSDRLAHAG